MLLNSTCEFDTLDRRDHVFAILGLWQQYQEATQLPLLLSPDYTLGLSTVFQNVTRFSIQSTASLIVLADIQGDPNFRLWPTWVPKWDHKQMFSRVSGDWSRPRQGRFGADNGLPMSVINRPDRPSSLYVQGLVIDKVTKTIQGRRQHSRVRDVRTLFSKSEIPPRNQSLEWIGTPDCSMETKVAMILTGGCTSTNIRLLGPDVLTGYKAYKRWLAFRNGVHKDKPMDNGPTETYEDKMASWWFQTDFQHAVNRDVFHTKDGHIGLGSLIMKPGDLLTVLYGSGHPVILRLYKRGEYYSVVGLAYVYGIMDGEAVQEYKARGAKDTLFCIR